MLFNIRHRRVLLNQYNKWLHAHFIIEPLSCGGSYEITVVSLPVSLSANLSFFSEITHWFFLIFGTILNVKVSTNWYYPFCWNWPDKHVQNTENRKLVIFLQYIKKKLSQLLCVLLWWKTFRYFSGVQSCSLLHVIMTISLQKLQSSVWYSRTAKIQKLQVLKIYSKCYCTFNIVYQTY